MTDLLTTAAFLDRCNKQPLLVQCRMNISMLCSPCPGFPSSSQSSPLRPILLSTLRLSSRTTTYHPYRLRPAARHALPSPAEPRPTTKIPRLTAQTDIASPPRSCITTTPGRFRPTVPLPLPFSYYICTLQCPSSYMPGVPGPLPSVPHVLLISPTLPRIAHVYPVGIGP